MKTRKFLSLALALALTLTLCAGLTTPAKAAEDSLENSIVWLPEEGNH